MFKVLARSTNIQKSVPTSKKIPDHQLPSAGLTNAFQHSGLDHDFSLSPGTGVSRGVKRKRREIADGHAHDVSGSVKGNGNQAKDTRLPGKPAKVSRDVGVEQQPPSRSVGDDGRDTPMLSQEDCRRMLRQHRLKVTVLQDPREDLGGNIKAKEYLDDKSKKHGRSPCFPQPLISFDLLRSKYGVSRRLVENLRVQGYAMPTEVQMGSLPLLLGSNEDIGLATNAMKKTVKQSQSELDLLTIAPTGSGKTLCFMIHLLHRLLQDRQVKREVAGENSLDRQTQALIVAPTHELADQIVNEGKRLAQGTGIRVSALRKGAKLQSSSVDKNDDIADYSEQWTEHSISPVLKADIVVSTPLMRLHAISSKKSTPDPLPSVRFLVLDEADVLLDPLFREQTLGIWKACTHKSLQTSLWSATIGSSIESLAQSFILDRRRRLESKPRHHLIVRLVVGLKDTAVPNISHRLVYAASEQGKLLALRQLLHPSAASTKDMTSLRPPFLIFTQTIPRAIALHSELFYDIPVEAGGSARMAVLHSDLSDTARSKIMAGFRKGEIWILITTDLLSRGVDFRGMNGVINYDIPNTGASYVHRVGRTGRQGREGGVAVTLYTKEDIPYVKNIANVIATSEKQKLQSPDLESQDKGVQKWLLDALPNVSKKNKKILKRRCVESRRVDVTDEEERLARKMRISTKSGYDRRLENNRKGAVEGRRKQEERGGLGHVDSEYEEWEGLDN